METKTQKERIAELIANQDEIIAQKKAAIKHGDGFGFDPVGIFSEVRKSSAQNDDSIRVRAVINTTNVLDSHNDVHLPGLWSKSLSENKRIMHLQEHGGRFSDIIASGKDLKAYTETFTFRELGFNVDGETQALVFDSNVKAERNPFMFSQYTKGYVDNHSVGMQYVKVELAVNDPDYKRENEIWNRYIDKIYIGRERAEAQGYFFAVREAKVIEGSAVPMGSNSITPTLEMKEEPSVESDTPAIYTTEPPAESGTLNAVEFKELLTKILR